MLRYYSASVQVTLILFEMAPKHKSSDAGNLNMPKRSCKVLPLSKKVKVLNFIRKGGNHILRLLRSMVRMNLLLVKLTSLEIKLYDRYVCIGINTALGFWHPLGVMECIHVDKGG